MKNESWRGNPMLRCQHLEKKISNQKARIRELEAEHGRLHVSYDKLKVENERLKELLEAQTGEEE